MDSSIYAKREEKKGKSMYVCLSTRCAGVGETEVKSVVICGRGRGGSQACPKERKLCGPQFRSFSSSYPILSFSLHLLRKSSYEPLIFKSSVLRRPFARAWVCTCAYAYNVHALHARGSDTLRYLS